MRANQGASRPGVTGAGLALIVAALLAACSVETNTGAEGGLEGAPEDAAAAAETFTIEMFVSETERLYLITDASDGTRVAARIAEGAATLIEPAEARNLLAERQGVVGDAPQETVTLGIPGFSLRVQADDNTGSTNDHARVSVEVAGRQVEVNATEATAGGTENAQVRLAGMSAADTREFIVGEDEIDPGLQQRMLDELGL